MILAIDDNVDNSASKCQRVEKELELLKKQETNIIHLDALEFLEIDIVVDAKVPPAPLSSSWVNTPTKECFLKS